MRFVVAALPNDPELAAWLGKKGSVNGITFYNRKDNDLSVVVLTPTDPAEKFYAVAEAVSLADVVIISTKKIDALFGEAVLAASLVGKKMLLTNENDVGELMRGPLAGSFEKTSNGEILEKLRKLEEGLEEAHGVRVEVDKAFQVKGVGTVLLGIVRRGTVKIHDTLKLGDGKEVFVRSIQVQDDNREEAGKGARVGLAVKGIDEKDVEKGEVLSETALRRRKEIEMDIKLSGIAAKTNPDGMRCSLVYGFSVSGCRIAAGENGRYIAHLDKPLQLEAGDAVLLLKESQPRIFASGVVKG